MESVYVCADRFTWTFLVVHRRQQGFLLMLIDGQGQLRLIGLKVRLVIRGIVVVLWIGGRLIDRQGRMLEEERIVGGETCDQYLRNSN